MTSQHDNMPSNFVQIANAALQCPFSIYILPEVVLDGAEKKYHARITLGSSSLRDYCKPILKALGMFVFESITSPTTLRVRASDKLMMEILDRLPNPSLASKFEGRLKKVFKDITFSSTLSDTTIDYIVAVTTPNIIPLLHVLEDMGIDDWEAVDNDNAIAFSLQRIPDVPW